VIITMEVELYVYDLSRGLARTMSASFLGVQIDAVYHTSIVMEGVEYGEAFECHTQATYLTAAD
jgi:hypothetical protein